MNATDDDLIVQPLIPLNALNITWLDILLPPLLILSSLLLYTLYNERTPIGRRAHVYRMITTHARFLPVASKHAFSYSTVFFGFDLSELENGSLNTSRLFRWDSSLWSIFSISPGDYLDKMQEGTTQGIRERLNIACEANGVSASQLGSVYMVTMPGYMGFHGINPLSVYFGYSELDGKRILKVVVLEVHNTFGERHLYYMQPGVNEDTMENERYGKSPVGSLWYSLELLPRSYAHQWTFPRSFHVSPFNDRSGYYQVSLVDPLLNLSMNTQPYFAVKVVLLTAETKEKKLMADLKGHAVPLSESSALSAIFQFPLALFLTTPRILYQAAKLHYKKKLDVFPKPEPVSSHAGELHSVNPVEAGGLAGNVLWQAADSTTEWVMEKLVAHLQQRVDHLWTADKRSVSIKITSTDPNDAPRTICATGQAAEELEIVYASYYFLIDILLSPSPELAILLGTKAERRWTVNNPHLFCLLLQSSFTAKSLSAQKLRRRQLMWSLSFATPEQAKSTEAFIKQIDKAITRPHFLDEDHGIQRTVFKQIMLQRSMYWVFGLMKARFVVGLEPWSEWVRAASVAQTSEGSIKD